MSQEAFPTSLMEQRRQLMDDGFRLAFAASPDEETGQVDQVALEKAVLSLEEEVGPENVAEIDGVFGLDGKLKPNSEAVSVFVRRPRDIYKALLFAAHEDLDKTHVYFLGDGITILMGQSTYKKDAPLRASLIDEKDNTLVTIGIGPEMVQVVGHGFACDRQVLTTEVATLRGINRIAPDTHDFEFDKSRELSLATPIAAGNERWVEGVRTLMHELASTE